MRSVRNSYLSLLSKMGIALLIFTLCRILFYAFNYSYFSELKFINFFGGLRYDWMAITILYAPFLLAHLIDYKGKSKVLKVLFHISNTLAIALNCMDFEYFKFTFKRTTADLFSTSGIESDILNLIPAFLKDYWYILIIAFILISFSEFLYRKTENFKVGWPGLGRFLLFVIPTFLFYAIGFRGGLQLRPLNVINAGQYAQAQNIPLVLNTPFTVIKSSYKETLTPREYFSEEELKSIYTPIQKIEGDSSKQHLNVVLIIAESFSKEYIGAFNDYEGYTPYLDQLIDKSLVFENAFANGKKSIEGLPAIIAGIPTLMNTSYISSKYGSNRIESLGSKLSKIGYRTVFYHGGENGTMGFSAFTQMAGIKEYKGRDQYPKQGDYDGNWGIFDEPFLQYCLEDINQSDKPFFASIFTLSSHHPYTIPEQHANKFKEGPLPILRSVEYADYALHLFFEEAKKQDWFNNTIFVITADHTSQSFNENYNNRLGMYAIPLIFYAPELIEPKREEKLAQQTDIFPSVIDQLGYESELLSFGQSVFRDDNETFVINYINEVYQLVQDDYVLHFDGNESIGLYHRIDDPDLEQNILQQEPKVAKKLERKIKAIIQQYNQRLIRNQLIP